jgi:hypothetical protein
MPERLLVVLSPSAQAGRTHHLSTKPVCGFATTVLLSVVT